MNEALAADFLEDNVEALGLRGMTILQVRAASPRGRWTTLANGTPFIEVDGKPLGVPVEPEAQETMISELAGLVAPHVVIFGLGVGHLVREVRARTTARVIVYEPDAGVLRTLLEAGPSDLGGIEIVTDLADFKGRWALSSSGANTATILASPGYDDVFPNARAELAEVVRTLLADETVVENTRRVRFRQWIDNTVANFSTLEGRLSPRALRDAFEGVPAFIVGAGPSLDKNVEQLRRAAERGIVIAVNTSASALAKRGIVPHMLVCIESIDLSEPLSRISFVDEVVRVMSMSTHPNNMRVGRGPLIQIHEALPSFVALDELLGPGIPVGGSVSTVAFSLAWRMGCNPIVLVGQDLAYTGGETYARGTKYEGSRLRIDGGTMHFEWSQSARDAHGVTAGPLADTAANIEVDAWGGDGKVPSTLMFNSFRLWFEVAAAVLKVQVPELRLVNATEGGARVDGFEEATLASVIDACSEIEMSPDEIVSRARARAAPLDGHTLRTWARKQVKLARAVKDAARELTRCAHRALRAVEQEEPRAVTRAFAALRAVESRFREACAAQPFVEGWSYARLHQLRGPTDRVTVGDSKEAALAALREEVAMAKLLAESAVGLERALEPLGAKPKDLTSNAKEQAPCPS